MGYTIEDLTKFFFFSAFLFLLFLVRFCLHVLIWFELVVETSAFKDHSFRRMPLGFDTFLSKIFFRWLLQRLNKI